MTRTIELETIANRTLEGALTRGADGVRVSAFRSRDVAVTYRKGKPDRIVESARRGISLHLYIDGRYTTCSTNDLRDDAVDSFLDRAIAFCRAMEPDPFRVMPDPSLYEGRPDLDLRLHDPAVPGITPDERNAWAAAAESAALEAAGSNVIQAETTWEDGEGDSVQIHSNGFSGSRRGTSVSGWAEVSLQDEGDKRPEGGWGASTRWRNDMPGPEEVGTKAAEEARVRLGAGKVETGRMTMVLDNRAVRRLLGYLLSAVSGQALQQKRSFLEGARDQPFGSALLDLWDDPFIPAGLSSRLWDGEGITARKMPIFEGGVFRNFYVDTYYGKKLEMSPTTGGGSNLVITPGAKSFAELVADVPRGILVRGFIGGNSNSTTGDFSVGVYGTFIENGELTRPVAEMNLAGNHRELWKRLVAAGNDPWIYGSVRVPTLVFDDVQFTGT